jgi:hypothetical protein
MAIAPAMTRQGLTEEDLGLLRHSDLAEARPDDESDQDRNDEHYDEHGSPGPAGFRERLALGDISWAKRIGSALVLHVFQVSPVPAGR